MMELEEIWQSAAMLRSKLDPVFGPDTAAQGFQDRAPSSGHCAAVAAIVVQALGGSLVSAIVDGHSHWFNRMIVGGEQVDVDLTGDQFGYPPVQISKSGALYFGTRSRDPKELTVETLERARLLAQRAGLLGACAAIDGILEAGDDHMGRPSTALSGGDRGSGR